MRIAFIFALTTLGLCITLLAGCTSDGSGIVGSGTIVSRERAVSNFTMLESRGSINVVVEYAPTHKVIVEADDNIVDRITTDVVNGTLEIDIQDGSYSNIKATVRITMPTINRVAGYGSGNISFTNAMSTENLSVVEYGSGNISFSDLTCQSITTEQVGSGNLTIVGSAATHNSKIRGSGSLYAFNCATQQTAVVIYGSGNANVNVSERLFADIFGSGNITYDGSPTIDQHVSGSGKIVKKL